MKAHIRKIIIKGVETGAILNGTPPNTIINAEQKNIIESHLEQYAVDVLYPHEGLNIFKDIYDNTANIVVIKDIDNIPGVIVDIP